MKFRIAAFFGLAAVFLALPAAAQEAQPKVGERIGDWVFQCQAVSASENICGLVQTIIDNNTKQQVVGVAIRYAGAGESKRLGMFVTVPLGIFLGSGIGGKIDAADQFKFNLITCNQRGCQGAAEITPAMLTDLKKGQRLIVGFKARADANTIAVPVSLKGFTDALKAIDAQ
jgi:invasion protein IalB